MIGNYFKTAFRIMMRQKGYSAINLAGLSIGLATSLLILLYITDELSFDRFHHDASRIYRIGFGGKLQGAEFKSANSPVPLAEGLRAEIVGVESTVRFALWRNTPASFDEKRFTESNFLVADSNFFQFFSFPLISGDPRTALTGANKIVLSQSAAMRYFGNENPVGKIMLVGIDKTAVEVSAVAVDAPSNTHIQFDAVLSGESWPFMRTDKSWTAFNLYTYFKMASGAERAEIEKQIDNLTLRHIGPELESFLGMTFQEFLNAGNSVGLFTQPLINIHLNSDLQDELGPNGSIQYVYIFGIVAAFILLVACINFMNLTTARSANRAKEIGIRKSVGAFRGKLVAQFISESMLYSLLSTIIAIAVITVLLPTFNLISGKSLTVSSLASPFLLFAIPLLTIAIGLLAGSYPALYLTAFRPSEVLKGKLRTGMKNAGLRNGLVVFQFIISIVMMFSSLVVYKQVTYMQEKNMGFDKENVIRLMHTGSLGHNAKAFKDEITSNPAFSNASFANELPPYVPWSKAFRKSGSEQDYILLASQVDVDHLETMKYKLVQGRSFSRDFRSDTAAVVVNEAAMRQMGLTTIENQTIHDYSTTPPKLLKIIGVVKDFNYESLRHAVKPFVLMPGPEHNDVMAIRLTSGNPQKKLELLESIWKKYSGEAFEFTFLDQDYDALFRSEQRMGSTILVFTVLTIFIACLGLFGLATYTSEQRAKEMSIRKVMGANASQIVRLLFKDLTKLVCVAFLLAIPFSLYAMHQWLEGFAYRVSVDIWTVLMAGLAACVIAVVSIAFQSVKAARENPVKALKSE